MNVKLPPRDGEAVLLWKDARLASQGKASRASSIVSDTVLYLPYKQNLIWLLKRVGSGGDDPVDVTATLGFTADDNVPITCTFVMS